MSYRFATIIGLLFVALAALGLVFPRGSSALEEVNLHVSSGISPNTLVYRFLIAKKNGFNELLFYGDDLEFVTAGVVQLHPLA